MGLDLILYKKTKSLDAMSMEEELESELAYGRKTWAIAHFFMCRCLSVVDDCKYIVTKQDWDEFIDSLERLNDKNFRKKIEDYIEYGIDEEGVTEKEELEIEEWLDGALNNDLPYTLGLDWELDAVLTWFDADSEVQKAFEENITVELIASY